MQQSDLSPIQFRPNRYKLYPFIMVPSTYALMCETIITQFTFVLGICCCYMCLGNYEQEVGVCIDGTCKEKKGKMDEQEKRGIWVCSMLLVTEQSMRIK